MVIFIIKMPNTKNIETVKKLREQIKKAKSVVFTDYLGLNAQEVNNLRHNIKEEEAELTIARNTLIKIALKEEGYDIEKAETSLEGPTAAIFSYKDPISPIKKLYEFADEHDLPEVKAAYIGTDYNSGDQVKVLSELPSKEELLTQVVVGLSPPIKGFASVLGGVQRNFVYAIKAVADKKEVSE